MRKETKSSMKAHLARRGAFYLLIVSAGILLAVFGPQSSGNISEGASQCIDDTWTPTSTTNAPAARQDHTAVWTGNEMIVWGGYAGGVNGLNTGGRYNSSTDSWTPISTTNAPAARWGHTAVWTGSEMIVWGGGANGSDLNTGGRYNPSTDSWTAISTTNAPAARIFHTAVWTGSEMIVWGGEDNNGVVLNTGARYNPSTDSWTATSLSGGPARVGHSAVWTGSEMIIWGGQDNGANYLNTGERYDPNTDSWTATSTTGAPSARAGNTAVWTGSEMIVWGGGFYDGTNHNLNTGGRYIPGTDSWTATSTSNVPAGRYHHTAVWTGRQMIVWGGTNGVFLNTGGRYNPSSDSWAVTSVGTVRNLHTAVWTGSQMIVWGGEDSSGYLNTGGRYCATTASPTPTPTPTKSCLVEQVSLCNSMVNFPPTDFTVQMSCPVDSVQESGFMVNNVGPDSFTVSKNTVTFHYNTSPAVPGGNYIHILLDAIICCLRPVSEFACTFTYIYDTPTPRPTPSPRATPTPRSRPTPMPRPTP
jgi:N-acetylneuraminic acid mutarotase